MGNNLLASLAILIAVSAHTAYASYDPTPYCQLVPVGTKFPSFDSCSVYYVCNVNGGVNVQQCPPNESFDKNSQACKPAGSVPCYIGMQDPCKQTTGTVYVSDPNNCRGYLYCKNSVEAGSGICPPKQMWNGVACIYGSCTNEGEAGDVQITNLCEIMQAGQYFGDFEACSTWHQCNAGTMKNGTCTVGKVFNTLRRMCLEDDGTMCSRVQNPSAPPTEPCNAADLGQMQGDENICSIYYKCDGTNWVKNTCPVNQYYDVNAKTCTARQSATPTTGCNRCQYATVTWVNAADPTCEEYLTCDNGNAKSTGSCGDGNYFNELKQGCVQGDTGLTGYKAINGACRADTTATTTTTTGTTESTTTTETTATGTTTTETTTTETTTTETTTTETTAKPDDTKPNPDPDTAPGANTDG